MASKKGKILIVDDNAGIRQALKILLPVHFAEVETLPSPVTLVSTLERFRPDVVLLDMNSTRPSTPATKASTGPGKSRK